MSATDSNMLIYIILAIIAILIVVSIVKKAMKLLIFLIMIFFLFFAYDVLIKGASPIEEAKGYISDVKYGKNVAEYSNKIKLSVDNIEKAILVKDKNQNTIDILTEENLNLNKYYDEVKNLEHREKFDSFHGKYCSYVKSITDSTAMICKVGNLTEEKNYEKAQEAIKKVKLNIEDLSKIKELVSHP